MSRLPVLAPEDRLVSLRTPSSFEADQYRTLRLIVEYRRKQAELHAVGVTSAGIGDGKTTTAINLAGALAQNPQSKVLLVDLDLRRPAVTHHLGMGHPYPGLVEAIINPELQLAEILLAVEGAPNLSVLPAGRPPIAPYEILRSERLGELLVEARRAYDFVVVDAPPAIPFPDCRLIEKWVEGFLVVVSAHSTQRNALDSALGVLDPNRVLGLVFNRDDSPVAREYHSYYAHYRNRHDGPDGSEPAGR